MKKIFIGIGYLAIIFMEISCHLQQSRSLTTNTDSVHSLATQMARRMIITDGHVDLPYRLNVINFRLEKEFLSIPIDSKEGDFDFVRAKSGGLDAPFMSIYVPASYQENGAAKAFADSLIDMVTGIAQAHPNHFQIATSPGQVKKIVKKGIIALPMGMENGAPVENDLSNVQYFRDRGISYITLTHSKDNQICDSSYDTTRTWNGLSDFGRSVVKEMNRTGVMVDISHVSDSTFYQVLEITSVPVIASHSSCRKFTPGFERNMNDDMILKLAQNGGVIMINFGSNFLDGKIRTQADRHREALRKLLAERNLDADEEEAKPIIEAYRKEHPTLYSDVQMVANHIDHVVSLVGIGHVGLGSDFDGVGDSLPVGLKDVSDYPNLINELLKRKYSHADIEKICSKNLFRVWEQVLATTDGYNH